MKIKDKVVINFVGKEFNKDFDCYDVINLTLKEILDKIEDLCDKRLMCTDYYFEPKDKDVSGVILLDITDFEKLKQEAKDGK